MNIVRDAARSGAQKVDDPNSPADIAKNIVVSPGKAKGGDVLMRVGVRGGARPDNNDPSNTGHWRFVEFGKEGVEARPFMRPALAENI